MHISTERTLATASNNVRVRLLLEDFDGTNGQNVVCKLIVGGVAVNPASVRPDEIVDTRSRWREYRFAPGAATTKYKIRIVSIHAPVKGATRLAGLVVHLGEFQSTRP